MKERPIRIPQVEKAHTWLTLVERQWITMAPQQQCIYGFIAVYAKATRNAKHITVARIECDQPEPAWAQGERGKVMAMLREAIGKATGKPTQQFGVDIIEWEVRDGQH